MPSTARRRSDRSRSPSASRCHPADHLQHADPTLPVRLRTRLPAHVLIDASPILAHTLDLAEEGRRDLVLFESRDLADERVSVANLIRRALPAAGIFAVADTADPAGLDPTLDLQIELTRMPDAPVW